VPAYGSSSSSSSSSPAAPAPPPAAVARAQKPSGQTRAWWPRWPQTKHSPPPPRDHECGRRDEVHALAEGRVVVVGALGVVGVVVVAVVIVAGARRGGHHDDGLRGGLAPVLGELRRVALLCSSVSEPRCCCGGEACAFFFFLRFRAMKRLMQEKSEPRSLTPSG